MIDTVMWLFISAVIVYVTGMITSTFFSLVAADKESAAVIGFVVAPFIVIALLIISAVWPL
jgi:hypothetical protein